MNRAVREKMLRQEFRIKELEQLLCPGEVHDWKLVESFLEYDGTGMSNDIKKYVCQKCLKVKRV